MENLVGLKYICALWSNCLIVREKGRACTHFSFDLPLLLLPLHQHFSTSFPFVSLFLLIILRRPYSQYRSNFRMNERKKTPTDSSIWHLLYTDIHTASRCHAHVWVYLFQWNGNFVRSDVFVHMCMCEA